MASLNEAESARDEFAEALRQLGAHAIGVEPMDRRDGVGSDFEVVAYFDSEPRRPIPHAVELPTGSQVPVSLRIMEPFTLE